MLTAFMGGLALGSHFLASRAGRIRSPARVFGWIEIGIGLYALCIPGLFSFLKIIYQYVSQNISDSLFVLTSTRFIFAALLLLIPTAFMGATLPVLSQGVLRQRDRFSTRLGFL